jgi:hypothetical protein
MSGMQKVQIGIMLEFDNVELLRQVQLKYHHKTLGHSIEFIIRQWQLLIQDKEKQRSLDVESKSRKPSNPMVDL